jgi:hypothetical protein
MSSPVAKAPTRIDVERLTSLGELFRGWQKRQGGSYFKTPSYLWDDAFELVPIFGARHVARELGLSREVLLRRMKEEQEPVVAAVPASAGDAPAASADPEFLEIEMEWPGVAMPPPASQPTVAEAQALATPVSCESERPSPAPAITSDTAPAPDATPLPAEEAWLEVVAPDGAKLTLRIPVNHLMNASALVREFRSQR